MDKVIVAQNLSLSYSKDETIINKVNFSIDSGSFVFITGASGSGKSTLLKSFYGAQEPQEGSLIVAGVELRDVSKSKLNLLRKHTGIVFQDYKLVKEWTIEKNISLPLIIGAYDKTRIDEQVEKLLKHIRLKHQSGKYPKELSGGERNTTNNRMELSHNPILILADEPTGNLDEYSSDLIWNLLVGANTDLGSTVIVVTHHIPENMNIDYKHFHIEYGGIHEVV